MGGADLKFGRWMVTAAAIVHASCGGPGDGNTADMGIDTGIDVGLDEGVDEGVDMGFDAGPPVPTCANLPGLYQPNSCSVLASPTIFPVVPRYVLWADGAEKERYFQLPAGTFIDGTDPDAWIFPVGTQVWKHFKIGGRRIETRYMVKRRQIDTSMGQSCQGTEVEMVSTASAVHGCWELRTFMWNAQETEVTEVVGTAIKDAVNSTHDIPSAPDQCAECHRSRDGLLGISAIQLNHGNAGTPLSYLIANNLIRNQPVNLTTSAVVPGSSATITDALGYLHANCGHCHNGVGGVIPRGGMRLWVPVGITDPAATPTYVDTIGIVSGWNATYERVNPGVPASSALIVRMSSRQPNVQMPWLATEQIDPTGIAAIAAWIASLPP